MMMRNAGKHADELKSLCRRLLKEHPAPPLTRQEPLPALVRAAMSYDVSDAKAEEAMRAIEKEFVDLNELRVATELEIQELLGVRYPAIEKRVAMITQALNAIFEKEHTLSLQRLSTVSRRDARQFLRDLPEMHPFVEAYVMLFALDALGVFPMDEQMLAYLREEGVVEEKSTLDEAQRFIENHLKAEECYPLYHAMRRVAGDAAEEASKRAAKAKAKA